MAQGGALWERTAGVRQALWGGVQAAGRFGLQLVQMAGSALKQQLGPSRDWLLAALRSAGITLPPVLLKVFAPQQRHQQQQQQRQRAQARRGSGSSGGGAQPRGGGTPEATNSSGGEEEPGRHQGQPSSAGPTGQPPGGQRAPEAPAQKPKGKGKGKGRKR
jgi:hypothetical protein